MSVVADVSGADAKRMSPPRADAVMAGKVRARPREAVGLGGGVEAEGTSDAYMFHLQPRRGSYVGGREIVDWLWARS